jgi:GNAT superfamily N-acetyltransferase
MTNCPPIAVPEREMITFASYTPRDWPRVCSALWFLPALYPRGDRWLARRLDQVEARKAVCVLALVGRHLAGLSIETPKQRNHVKLSTFWIAPRFRKCGIGRALLTSRRESWLQQELWRVWVTVDSNRVSMLSPVFCSSGFALQTLEAARYGPDRDEAVFVWSPDAPARSHEFMSL